MSKFTKKELENSKRIFKSATPKYTIDWYLKWVASFFILMSMSIRGVTEFAWLDLTSSTIYYWDCGTFIFWCTNPRSLPYGV